MYRRAVLHKWQNKLGPKATYRNLLKAFVEAGKGRSAETVCKLLAYEEELQGMFTIDLCVP